MEVIRAFAPIRRLTDWKLQNLITEKYSRLFDGTKMPVSANGTILAFVRAEQFFSGTRDRTRIYARISRVVWLVRLADVPQVVIPAYIGELFGPLACRPAK